VSVKYHSPQIVGLTRPEGRSGSRTSSATGRDGTLTGMVETAPQAVRPPRQRNPRGEGHRLRSEILAGASTILERTGSEEAITLRAIAREIGIAAPSISPHFADRAAIIDAVVADHLTDLAAQLSTAASIEDPIDALFAAWDQYLHFGRRHPSQYRVIFERRFLPLWDDEQRPMADTGPLFEGTVDMMVGLLQTCIDAGLSTSTNALKDSVSIWYFAHGIVALPIAITSFPWPQPDSHLAEGITVLAHLTRPIQVPVLP
jgi:AcrR family transcriptional regulator